LSSATRGRCCPQTVAGSRIMTATDRIFIWSRHEMGQQFNCPSAMTRPARAGPRPRCAWRFNAETRRSVPKQKRASPGSPGGRRSLQERKRPSRGLAAPVSRHGPSAIWMRPGGDSVMSVRRLHFKWRCLTPHVQVFGRHVF
jgi:hypothetical protein